MKSNKFNALALVAMLATAGAAYAFTPETTKAGANENTWARDQNGQWQNLTELGLEEAPCVEAAEACKVFYDQNAEPITGTDADPGYRGESEETGYVNIP